MKTLVLTDVNCLELVDRPIPKAGNEEAVVRVKYAGICGSDLHIMVGQHPTATPPFVMGHEVCGEIVELNSDRCHDIKPGDKVAVHAVKGCGSCEMCRSGRENLCNYIEIMGAGCDGFYSEYVKCRADRIIKLRSDVDMKIGALIEPLTIAVHDIRRSGLQAGEDVFIAGAGVIGVLIGMVAKLTGAAKVVMAEIDQKRIELVKSLGFDVVDISADDFDEQCIAYTNGKKYDRLFEVTGFQGGLDACLKLLKQGATIVQVGMPGNGVFSGGFNVNAIIFNEANYLGVRNSTSLSMYAAAKIISDGLINQQLMEVISAVYPKERGREAFEAARYDKSLLKILIDFS